ncbi:Alstrom syndrome protein 1 [Frankliniella fusca]|uniref:Alstrom syndrome protein 1 n=1 Tax=Frankliniella fusca TaxID=407009 RepID=A0AAE1HV39_9NEOP|nr:Alstrom syndrome protein 1 [Frankliniella fusca]
MELCVFDSSLCLSMDSKPTKAQGRRQPQEEESLSSRRANRLFLSETVPPSTHHQAQASQSRSHNLSDRIHEYYEKLVNTPLVKKIDNTSASPQFPSSNFQNRFDAGPKFREPLHSLSSVRTVLQPANTNARQSYTVFVEDPSGAFQQFVKKKPLSELNEPPCHDNISQKANVSSVTVSMRGLMDKKKSSPTSSRGQCNLCHSSNHPSHSCTLQSRVPAEHDGYPSDPLGDSPSTLHSKLGNENQGDGSEDRSTSVLSFPKKRTIPANISVSCERDVIGQEKSPVSKSHPTSSTALSTSSSNGDTVPRERKKWVRPPLVGQAASSSEKSPFMGPGVFDCLDDHGPALDGNKQTSNDLQLSSSTGSDQADSRDPVKGFSYQKSSYFDSSNKSKIGLLQSDDFYSSVDRDTSSNTVAQLTSEGEQGLSDSCAGGRVSPSSSVTSSRRLEWDSGADVGYNQMYGSTTPDASSSGLCTIERMALAQGCSVALHLRLDPEGTTVPTSSSGRAAAILPSPVQDKQVQSLMGKPTAESTPVDQLPHKVKALRKHHHDTKSVISPIVQGSENYGVELQSLNTPWVGEREEKMDLPKSDGQKSKDSDTAGSSPTPFHRQISNSMQDLRSCIIKESELQKSHSDPDVTGEMPISTSRQDQSKFLKEISKNQNVVDTFLATHSVSSGSDATLVRMGTEEDLANDMKENVSVSNQSNINKSGSDVRSSSTSPETSLSKQQSHSKEESNQPDNTAKELRVSSETKSFQTPTDFRVSSVTEPKQNKSSGNMHVCSDSDHVRGLHHHFGVLCSTVLGGHIQSSVQPNPGSQPEIHGPDMVYVQSVKQSSHCKPDTLQSAPLQSSEYLGGESTGSSAFHSDVAHDENVPCASTLTGRANSFEYLPGHMYERKSSSGLRKHERPPGISTSTETDSEPVRPISRVAHRKVSNIELIVMDSSSHDTEDERLWGSPQMGSNSLVLDLERGLNLLKGVMENKSAGRRCKRELIRRIIKKLVTSEYVEDIIEKERIRHQTRSPFSPRKTKYQDRQDRNFRSKRYVGPERQDISGESDEPKRSHNVRRKLPTYQTTHHSEGPKTLSTLASGSKSSSLWSSNAESTSGSISLSGSSENQKESKTSVKTNPLYEHEEKTADWLKPATQSEKLFEMRKSGTSHAEKHLASLIGVPPQDPVLNPFKIDTQKQLSWVSNEINNLKILKQLLQKQESLKQSLDPNLCQVNLTAMPVTGLKQTMQMADCTSPDIPESHSPRQKPSRMRAWISLESDTSAGFGLSNNTVSSRDSHWQDVEVACPGEQDSLPHRTVSISDADEGTEASCSVSNRKSDGSHKSSQPGAQAHKPRRRSVSISDTDQLFGPPSGSDSAVQKRRSDCHCGKPDVSSVRPQRTSTYGPPPRNLSSDKLSKQVCERCASHSHVVKRDTDFPASNTRGVMSNRAVSSAGAARTVIGLQSEHLSQAGKCICGGVKAQTKNCCCSSSGGVPLQATGAVRKGTAETSHQMVPKVVAEVTSRSAQPLPGKGLVRVHIETQQEQDSAQAKSESQRSSVLNERVRIADVSDDQFSSGYIASDDSITKAVRQAVSSKVKALKSIGQIEEAEVKIRVKVTPDQVSDSTFSQSGRGRVLKSQDLEDENVFHPSKHSEMEDLISKQIAMDLETRQKLLAIAESRQRAQMGLHDVDRRIQDLLLQDYLSRQFKPPESTSSPRARLNVRVETPVLQGNSVGVQSDVDKKNTGTITSAYLQQSPPPRNDQSYTLPSPQISQPPPQEVCICGTKSLSSARQPQSVVNQGQQTDAFARPQTAPGSCLCSCQSQLASSARTFHASSPVSERQVEFELDLWKKHPPKPYQMTPHEVHETLKSRNTAYFLQFEEDPSLEVEPEPHTEVSSKPQMEVVTVKIPKTKPGSSYRPSAAQGGKKPGKSKGPSKRNAPQTVQFGGKDQQGVPSDQIGVANLLRTTPGRSHLSITITDSSADSIMSPNGDSMYSSLQHPSRKKKENKRREKIDVSVDLAEGEGSPTSASPKEGSKSPCTGESSSKLNPPKDNSKLPASDSESIFNYLGDHNKSVPTLQEYLERNHPKYLDAAEKRRRCIAEMSYLRHLRQQSRRRLLELEGDNMWVKQKEQWRARCISRPRPTIKKRPILRVSKSACARKYMFLPENQQRLAEIKKREEKRTNRLMAELYTRKLQEKVLKGTATIRSSVSVLSGL